MFIAKNRSVLWWYLPDSAIPTAPKKTPNSCDISCPIHFEGILMFKYKSDTGFVNRIVIKKSNRFHV